MRRLLPLAIATLGLCVALPAAAMPRFAARTGMTCSACHTNPSGGGMRSSFGASVYSPRFLALPALEEVRTDRWLDPQPTRTVGLGADIRAVFLHTAVGDTDAPEERQLEDQSTFFLMQADLYLRADLAEWVTLYHDQGVYGEFESMALFRAGPVHFKVGRFIVPFGWKLANHTTWTRERLGFGATDRDIGLEIGLEIGPLVLSVAGFNGSGSDLLDENVEKGIASRFDLRFGQGRVRGRFGGSVYWNISGEETDDGDERREELRAGGHYGFFVGRFGLLGEVDYKRVDDRTKPFVIGSLIGMHELSFLAWQGVDLRVTWEHLDPDLQVDGDLLQRIGVGVEVYPFSGVEVQLLVRYVLADENLPEAGLVDVTAMAHVWF